MSDKPTQTQRREQNRQKRREWKRQKLEKKMERRRCYELPNHGDVISTLMARPEGQPLESYAERVTSQHGEDGMTVEVFRRAGFEHRRGVEIGCGANGGNAGVLVAGFGFDALLLDGSEELTTIARRVYADHQAKVVCAWIMRETVNELLVDHGFGENIDYVGIDLDGVDLWIWQALSIRPRVVICEYNPIFGPDAAVTIPYRPDFWRKARTRAGDLVYPKGYYGASVAGLVAVGRQKGYRLVGTAPGSENAYFVRDDVDERLLPEVPSAAAWRPRTKGKAAKPLAKADERYEQIEREGVPQYFKRRGAPLVDLGSPSSVTRRKPLRDLSATVRYQVAKRGLTPREVGRRLDR